MDEPSGTCERCGGARPAEGPCPRCGASVGWDWPDTDPDRAAGAPVASGAPGPPPPPAPDLSAGSAPGATGPRTRSDNSGCGRAALVVGLVLLVLLALGAVLVFTVFRSLDGDGVIIDVDEDGGTIEFGDGPDTYGDDPLLDALWDGCEAGDMADCDQLYFDSPIGSEYEEFGDTCGRRREPGGICDQ